MTIQEANKRLLEILAELKIKIPELNKAEWQYEKRFLKLAMESGFTNQSNREGDAKLITDAEGLYEPYLQLKMEVRLLLTEKEIVIEYCKNIRSLEVDK